MSVLCDTDSGCARKARWYITTKAGELPMCDLHSEFYLRQGRSIYPRRGVPGMLIPCQRDESCWLSDKHAGPHEHIDGEGRRIVQATPPASAEREAVVEAAKAIRDLLYERREGADARPTGYVRCRGCDSYFTSDGRLPFLIEDHSSEFCRVAVFDHALRAAEAR